MFTISRRSFLKTAVATGAVTAFPEILVRKTRADWARGTAIHPNIDNLRVVGVSDPGMTKAEEPASTWRRQEELVNREAVWKNLDRLACALTETRGANDAWRAAFVKPAGKSWQDVVVAIKTNCIAQQHTRSAVMSGICHALTDTMGVKGANIHIYDACSGGSMIRNMPFAGLPAECRLENKWGGSNTLTPVPGSWSEQERKAKCLQHLVDGSVDILINIAMCKGHSRKFGGFTMAMKNHFGTFSPKPGHQRNGTEYLIRINQTPEILGPMDAKTGKIVCPRQQLCIVDALWASKTGPRGVPSDQPNFLAMGALAPVVDYQVATKFRGRRMGWQPNMEVTERLLTDFGYSGSDLPEGGRLIEV